jgi:hypothetical protein
MRSAALLATTLVTAVTALTPAPAAAQKPIAWGAFTPGAPEDRSAIDRFNSRVGRKAAILHTYKNFDWDPFPRDTVAGATNAGALPFITWEPHNRNLRAIARGDHDAYLRDSARSAARFGKPILLRFAHEMNANWFPWGLGVNGNTADDYKSAWRHIVRIFRQEKADNVKHVWTPNTGTFNSLWPGDDYVDYLGLDGYNWGAKYGTWESFEQVFDSSYKAIVKLSRKPLIIAEFGANQRGGDKPAWIRHAFSRDVARRYPRIRALMWFDINKEADWRVNSSDASLDAFRSVLNQSLFDLDAAGLWRLGGGNDDTPEPAAPAPPAQPPAGGALRCGIYPRATLRRTQWWEVDVPIRCNRSTSGGCNAIVKVKHVGTGRTLGTAEVELTSGRRRPVRIGLTGWSRTSLASRSSVPARISMRVVGSGCRAAATRRATLSR